jgi:hypothetical protein
MKKMKILAIATFSVFVSTNMQAGYEIGGTVTNWNIETGEITCASSQRTCFGVNNYGELYFPDLGVRLEGYGNPVQIGPNTWLVPKL